MCLEKQIAGRHRGGGNRGQLGRLAKPAAGFACLHLLGWHSCRLPQHRSGRTIRPANGNGGQAHSTPSVSGSRERAKQPPQPQQGQRLSRNPSHDPEQWTLPRVGGAPAAQGLPKSSRASPPHSCLLHCAEPVGFPKAPVPRRTARGAKGEGKRGSLTEPDLYLIRRGFPSFRLHREARPRQANREWGSVGNFHSGGREKAECSKSLSWDPCSICS